MSLYDSLEYYWPMSQPNGSRTDLIGGLTLSETHPDDTTTVTGRHGNGTQLGFDSLFSTFAALSKQSAIAIDGDWSVAVWIKSGDNANSTRQAVAFNDGGDYARIQWDDPTDKWILKVKKGGTVSSISTGNGVVDGTTWQLFQMRHSGSVTQARINSGSWVSIDHSQGNFDSGNAVISHGEMSPYALSIISLDASVVWSRELDDTDFDAVYDSGEGFIPILPYGVEVGVNELGGLNPSGVEVGTDELGGLNPSGVEVGTDELGGLNPSGVEVGTDELGGLNPSGVEVGADELGGLTPSGVEVGTDELGGLNPSGVEVGTDELGGLIPSGVEVGTDELGGLVPAGVEVGADSLETIAAGGVEVGADELGELDPVGVEVGADGLSTVTGGGVEVGADELPTITAGGVEVGADGLPTIEGGGVEVGADSLDGVMPENMFGVVVVGHRLFDEEWRGVELKLETSKAATIREVKQVY